MSSAIFFDIEVSQETVDLAVQLETVFQVTNEALPPPLSVYKDCFAS